MNKSEQLIACLEGEIAKRDETIVRLEPQLNRAIQANYDLREELAACRIAVENCELFRAELAAIKAQDPVAWVGAIEGGVPLLMVEPQNWKATPLYAEPVSEAKAQGVVQWPNADEIMQMAFEEGHPADDASGYYFELEEFDLFIDRLMSEVARLNAVPVQKVSMPDGKVCVPVEVLRLYEFMAASFTPFTSQHEQIAISLRKAKAAMLAAAPAAPAADAGKLADAFMSWKLPDSVRPDGCAMDPTYPHRYGTNLMTWAQAKEMFEYVLVAHRAKGVV